MVLGGGLGKRGSFSRFSSMRHAEKGLFDQQSAEDVVDMSTTQVMKTYSTGCKSCISILEGQAGEDMEKIEKSDRRGAGKYFLKTRKIGDHFKIEILKKRI